MESDARQAGRNAKRWFSGGILAYGILCVVAALFVHSIFGLGLASGILLILALPAVVSLRIAIGWQRQSRKDFVFLLALLIAALGAAGYVVQGNYDRGMAQHHIEELKANDFARTLRSDPAYRDLKAHFGGKGTGHLSIEGTVRSADELARLNSLVDQSGVHAFVSVKVNHR